MKTSGLLVRAAAVWSLAFAGPALAAAQDQAAADSSRSQRRPGQPASDSGIARRYADLDRLSDLVLQLDELRADGADDLILADARARIAAELRLDPSEEEPGPDQAIPSARGAQGSRRQSTDTRRDQGAQRDRRGGGEDQGADQGAGKDRGQHISPRVQARAAQITARQRALIRELRLLQLRIDAGTDDAPTLAADQDAILNEYLKLAREEIRLGLREGAGGRREGDRD